MTGPVAPSPIQSPCAGPVLSFPRRRNRRFAWWLPDGCASARPPGRLRCADVLRVRRQARSRDERECSATSRSRSTAWSTGWVAVSGRWLSPYIFLFSPATQQAFRDFSGLGGVRVIVVYADGGVLAQALLERASSTSSPGPCPERGPHTPRTEGTPEPGLHARPRPFRGGAHGLPVQPRVHPAALTAARLIGDVHHGHGHSGGRNRPEVTEVALSLLRCGRRRSRVRPPAGGHRRRWTAVRDPLPQATLDSIQRNGVVLKGPMTTPVGSGFRSVNVAIREASSTCMRTCGP